MGTPDRLSAPGDNCTLWSGYPEPFGCCFQPSHGPQGIVESGLIPLSPSQASNCGSGGNVCAFSWKSEEQADQDFRMNESRDDT